MHARLASKSALNVLRGPVTLVGLTAVLLGPSRCVRDGWLALVQTMDIPAVSRSAERMMAGAGRTGLEDE